MALNKDQLLQLMKTVAQAQNVPSYQYSNGGETFSYSALCETLRDELKGLAGTYSLYRRNQVQLFELIEETLDLVLPRKVMEQYGEFAEVKTFAQGTKPVFTRKMGRQRAKQFITKVGLAGRYEVFKLGGTSFEVPTSAIGGAAQIGLEEFLDGRVDFSEVLQIVMEGMDELIYKEIAEALVAGITQLPNANKVVVAGFDENGFDRLIAISGAYGLPTIYCTYEFAVKMAPVANWISDSMKNEKWAKGYFANYKGNRVIILPQSFTDETNATKVINPGYCWIIPAGNDGQPAKVAFEGGTIVSEFTGVDQSRDVQVYKKVGVNVMMANHICSYIDTELLDNMNTIDMFGFNDTNGTLVITQVNSVYTANGTQLEADHATVEAMVFTIEDAIPAYVAGDSVVVREINPALELLGAGAGIANKNGVWVKDVTLNVGAGAAKADYVTLLGEGLASASVVVTHNIAAAGGSIVTTFYTINSDITFKI